MKHPSIRLRLILGSTLLVAAVLVLSKIAMYREIERALRQELDDRLLYSANVLSKSAELEAGGIIYEWQEALLSTPGSNIEGLFQFWDLKSGRVTRSPDLGTRDLKFFHGELHQPSYENIILADGKPARAIGFLHLPFTNEYGREEMRRRGTILSPADYPQVIVCARDTSLLDERLAATRMDLLWSAFVTLLAVWLAILLITHWTLRPLDKLAAGLLKRSSEVGTPLPEIPPELPKELVPLASAFRSALEKVEIARGHEKDFAFSAAHQLRTPIAGMHAILEQAVSRPREVDNLRERITRALGVAREMRHTVDSLMNLARLRGGIDEVAPAPFHPLPLIRSLVEQEQESASGQRQVELVLPDQVLTLHGDERLFGVLVSILIENAFRYTRDGGRIWIKADTVGEKLMLNVANEARDFNPDDAERIFRPFQRGSNTSVNSAGAGLGLALAKEIAQRIGASLDLVWNGNDAVISFRLKLGTLQAVEMPAVAKR